jgi:DNA-binding response OmpR family regulator
MKLAVADEDQNTRHFLLNLFTQAGHDCTAFHNSSELMSALESETHDLLIVDWVLATRSAVDLVRRAHEQLSPCPLIIVLTNQSDKVDIIDALNSGADDYIVKPEQGNVILARVEAVIRRGVSQRKAQQRIESFGSYSFDSLTSNVIFDGEEIILTAREYQLARLFFQNPNRAFSRAYILQTLWNSVPDLATRTLDMHISRIRSKLRLVPENGFRIQTIFGHGYRLEAVSSER